MFCGNVAAKDFDMKKMILFLVVAFVVSVNCFAQKMSDQAKALQGTWVMIGIMNDEESYDEQAIKAENLEILYIFSGDTVTIKNNGETIGPAKFQTTVGYLVLENGATQPYNLQGKILILHEGGITFIYRKR